MLKLKTKIYYFKTQKDLLKAILKGLLNNEGKKASQIIFGISGQYISKILKELEEFNYVIFGISQLTNWQKIWYITDKGKELLKELKKGE